MHSPASETVTVYAFVAIDVPAALAAAASEQLFALGASGVEQRDTTTLIAGARSTRQQSARDADVGAPTLPTELEGSECVTLVAAFDSREAAEEARDAFDAELSPRIEEVVGDAWRDAWKAYFEPFRLSPRLVVRPPWREVSADLAPSDQDHILELEPGRAFGTGLHESTMLVAHALDARQRELEQVDILDVGCGSGILSIAALALGARSARAIDVDADAARVASENASRNDMSGRLVADAADLASLQGTWRVVVANIQAEVLTAIADCLATRVASGGLLILSGILAPHGDSVRRAYPSFLLEETATRGEWVALILRAPA